MNEAENLKEKRHRRSVINMRYCFYLAGVTICINDDVASMTRSLFDSFHRQNVQQLPKQKARQKA